MDSEIKMAESIQEEAQAKILSITLEYNNHFRILIGLTAIKSHSRTVSFSKFRGLYFYQN